MLGGVYIPPEDSHCYQHLHYGSLAAHTVRPEKVVAMCDFNARVGEPHIMDSSGDVYEYNGVKDYTGNSHGRTLVNMCINNSIAVDSHLTRKTIRG